MIEFTPIVQYALHKYPAHLNDTFGRVDGSRARLPENQSEPFCHDGAALKIRAAANGVSELHGEVSRHM